MARAPILTLAAVFVLLPAHAAGKKPNPKLAALKKKLGVEGQPILGAEHLSKTYAKLAAAKGGEGKVRILHLGDSHIASDYISGPIRARLQAEFGDAGRGFMHIDHRMGYGGRVLTRAEKPWIRTRHVDLHKELLPFGFSAMKIESKSKGAEVLFQVLPGDARLRIFYERWPSGAPIEVLVDGKSVKRFETKGEEASLVEDVPLDAKKKQKLALKAADKGAALYGVSFEADRPGVLYEPIGPVGADAKLYLEFGRRSFEQHLAAHQPDLYVLMVGGNDALKIRKGWQDLAEVERHHVELIDLLRKITPNAECILWTPMDAGEKKGGKVVSKGGLPEMAAMQLRVAKAKGCAAWDMYALMGGEGAITTWAKAGVMNADLVHPKQAAADLLGEEFADAFLGARR